ncbi:MAG: globin domain-containing protein [Pseudomonadota bacterium]|nr:MAG: flavohemoprotein [Pseudomonadota bacterium]
MSLNVELLRNSFAMVVEREPQLTRRFYDILFTRYPQVRPLFGRNQRQEQERMLTEMLVKIMDHLEDEPWLAQQLGALGARHRDYGVTAEMYDFVGASLLEALREVAGNDWTPACEAAWSEAYGAIARLMQASAQA